MSTERNPNTGAGGDAEEERAEEALDEQLQDPEDLAHGGSEAKAEELEKEAYGDQDRDGETDTPYTQFPG
ncbi:hypothetical protein ACFQ36_13755 [Arthrobacter sp. GCM10027362]|uniref:hypothetical protein n=1 Tax=Arthrobacter sp. GCM10027362 TaxID=3273379 RepID=UPI0036367F8D